MVTQVATYQHYPSFTRRYVRSILHMTGQPKKAKHEAELLRRIAHSRDTMSAINGEVLMLEWFQRRQGHVIVPEPSLALWLQQTKLSRVEGEAWSWPYEFSTISVPTAQRFAGHPVEGVLVAWIDSERQPERFAEFMGAHGCPDLFEMPHVGGQWLIVAIHNPLDKQPKIDPSILRIAFRPDQITDFINREAINETEYGARKLESEETTILNAVLRWVLSLGMYLSAYPEALTSGVPEWMKNKHPDGRHGVAMAKVGYDSADRELHLAMLSPRSVAPHWRQLRDSRFYQGKWAQQPRGSRYVLVSGYEVSGHRTAGVRDETPGAG